MRNVIFNLLEELNGNDHNCIIFYEGNTRHVRTYTQFYRDIVHCVGKLDHLELETKRVAILGPTSYQWMVIDYACIKGGYHSIALPEGLSRDTLEKLVSDTVPDIILADYSIKETTIASDKIYYYACIDPSEKRNFDLFHVNLESMKGNRVRADYGTAFSSGTSENIKKINLTFTSNDNFENDKSWFRMRSADLLNLYRGMLNLFVKADNKIIIYLPFSHSQQRDAVHSAFMERINIVLSRPEDCIRHLIIEKPNTMVSVPIFYDTIAARIKEKLKRFSAFQKKIYSLYKTLRIYSLSRHNLLRKLFDRFLFKDIKKLYGGRADYFITGSAPINKETLEIFYSVGVKIYEGYGQSELDLISMNGPKKFRLGSVGKPYTQVKISEDSEILVKYDEEEHGANKARLTIRDGYIYTGDSGYLDKDGFLFLNGRLDDVIILSNGKKIFPHTLEQAFKKVIPVNQLLIFADQKSKIKAVLFTETSFVSDKITESIRKKILHLNTQLATHEKIDSFLIIDEPFTIENNLMTSNFKLKRKSIISKYSGCAFQTIN